jgi:small subunit ribosomal protein S1
MSEIHPHDMPIEEGYWRALMEGGESGGMAAPPPDPIEVWQSLGLAQPDELETLSVGQPDQGWDSARQAMENETVLDLPVVGFNRGGLLVDWQGHQGFVPASHLSELSPYLDEQEREQELCQRVGDTLCLKVIEVDPDRRRLVLSERATRTDENRRRECLDQLAPGLLCSGRVTNLCSFGAFVNIGDMEGLVHISEISWGRVSHPSDVLTPGQQIDVYVLNIDRDRGRVGLSIKRAQPDPWETLEERYQVGQVVEATITNVVEFGAFAQVEDGIEGLIHVSELAENTPANPSSIVQEGSHVQLRVINLDGERRRLGLSLRQAAPLD